MLFSGSSSLYECLLLVAHPLPEWGQSSSGESPLKRFVPLHVSSFCLGGLFIVFPGIWWVMRHFSLEKVLSPDSHCISLSRHRQGLGIIGSLWHSACLGHAAEPSHSPISNPQKPPAPTCPQVLVLNPCPFGTVKRQGISVTNRSCKACVCAKPACTKCSSALLCSVVWG